MENKVNEYKYLSEEYVKHLNSESGQKRIKQFLSFDKNKKESAFKDELCTFLNSQECAYFNIAILNNIVDAWNNAKIHLMQINLDDKNCFQIDLYLERPGYIIGKGGELIDAFTKYYNEILSFSGFSCQVNLHDYVVFKRVNYDSELSFY